MDENLSEIKVESFWGAIACFVLLQIFGYVIFQTFLVSLNSWFTILMGGGFLFLSLFFQSECFYKIMSYVSKNKKNFAIESLNETKEKVKLVLAILFIVILIFFALGHYPLQQKDYSFFVLILFYVATWLISLLISKLRKHGVPIWVATGPGRLMGIIVGFIFFIIAFFNESIPLFNAIPGFQDYSLFLGTLGLGVCIILISSLLLQDQIKHIN